MDPATIALIISGLMSAAGAAGSAFGKSKKPQTTQLPNLNPQQQQGQAQALQQALAGLKDPTAGFEPIQQQQMNQFYQQTVPNLSERFTAMGEGAQRGSGFQGALGQAGAGLGTNLAAMKAQYGLQNQGNLQNLLGMGLRPQFENIYQQGGPGEMQKFGGNLFGAAMPMMGQAGLQMMNNSAQNKQNAFQASQSQQQGEQQQQLLDAINQLLSSLNQQSLPFNQMSSPQNNLSNLFTTFRG